MTLYYCETWHRHRHRHMHKHTRTHTQTHIHTHPFTRTQSHTQIHTRARAHTHIHIHADAHPTYRAFVPAHELRNGNAISCHVNGILRHVNESWHTYEWVTHMNESRHMYEGVMAHIWRSHGTVPLYQRTNSSMEMLFCASFIISSACVCVYASARLICWIWSVWKCTVFLCVCICEYNRRCKKLEIQYTIQGGVES